MGVYLLIIQSYATAANYNTRNKKALYKDDGQSMVCNERIAM